MGDSAMTSAASFVVMRELPRASPMRILGSPDNYGHKQRECRSNASTLWTCHDGFTLNDLLSFNSKHNEATAAVTETARTIIGAGTSVSMALRTTLQWRSCETGK